MEIITHGKFYNQQNHIAECTRCGCKFRWNAYDINDIKRVIDDDLYYGHRKFDCGYVKCPECNYNVLAFKKEVTKTN